MGAISETWTGWYEQDGKRHSGTTFTKQTVGQVVTGQGSDDVGEFQLEGELKGKDQILLSKTYFDSGDKILLIGTKSVKEGKLVIDGTWTVAPSNDGGQRFHFEQLPELLTSLLPPVGVLVSIRASSAPNAYLRLDGNNGQLNLQVGRSTYERFELVPQDKVGGEQVYAIKSQLFNQYVRLDPTLSPDQVPINGIYQSGVGRASPVKVVDQQSKFTVVVVHVDGVFTHSFKLLDSSNPDLPTVFLRLNARDLSSDEQVYGGGGVVNGQNYIGVDERLLVEPFPAS